LAKSELSEPQSESLLSYTGGARQKYHLGQLALGYCLGQAMPYTVVPNEMRQGHRVEGKQGR
jgi:hypothetical protein